MVVNGPIILARNALSTRKPSCRALRVRLRIAARWSLPTDRATRDVKRNHLSVVDVVRDANTVRFASARIRRRARNTHRVGVGQQRTDGQQNLGNRQRRRPLLLQDIKADLSRTVDVTVVDSRAKRHFRRLEWVIRRKLNIQKEDAILVRRIYETTSERRHDSA